VKSYDYYLFDWDGCLAKTLDAWLIAIRTALNEYGAFPADPEISITFGDWEFAKTFGVEDWQGCAKRAEGMVFTALAEVELYPGAHELLQQLKRGGKKLALLSSSTRRLLDMGIARNKLEGVFDVVLAAEDVTHHKPHPEIIEKALAALGGRSDQAVMIGDSRKDLGAATNAQVDSILVYPPSHTVFYELDYLKTYNPTYVVDGFEMLQKQLA
jgi:pyrophosphatase PpaX